MKAMMYSPSIEKIDASIEAINNAIKQLNDAKSGSYGNAS